MASPAEMDMIRMPKTKTLWLPVFLVLALAGSARAGESFYMIVFGSQLPKLNLPAHTHNFAIFLRATGEGCCMEQYRLEGWTISWMPQSLQVKVLRLRPECGVNLGLHQSLAWALEDGQRISMWGPYQIRKELFDRALAQVARLQSGAVAYKAINLCRCTDQVTNCIHAVSSLSTDSSRLQCGIPGWGESASYLVVLNLATWIIDPHQTHDWLISRLGLDRYPLVRRDLS
jgi:hypothetical protein